MINITFPDGSVRAYEKGITGYEIAKGLGAPKAMDRMRSYLLQARPQDPETIVDEMLAIRAEIDAWRYRKRSEEANAKYNELLRYGFDGPEDE